MGKQRVGKWHVHRLQCRLSIELHMFNWIAYIQLWIAHVHIHDSFHTPECLAQIVAHIQYNMTDSTCKIKNKTSFSLATGLSHLEIGNEWAMQTTDGRIWPCHWGSTHHHEPSWIDWVSELIWRFWSFATTKLNSCHESASLYSSRCMWWRWL